MISALFSFLFFCRRPDVIVATSPQFFCGCAGVLASWLKWRPLVLEIRDIWPESIVSVGAMNDGFLVRIFEFVERWMYRNSAHIVTVGNGYKANIVSKIGCEDRISVVTNGVDSELFLPQDRSSQFRAEHGLGDKFVCSYVGTIGMAHGLSVVVRAAERLKDSGRSDIIFCLVGDGASRSEIAKQAELAGVGSLIRFTGRLPKPEMPTVLASSSCILIHLKKTDLFETVIPSKIFEAMAMERPLIMGVQGESADIVKASQSGIQIESENDLQLFEAVVQLCDNPDLQKQLSTNGRSFVTENYSRDLLASTMLSTIQQVVSDRGAQ